MNLAQEHANAQPGAVIRVPAGSHGDQRLTLAKPITFIADPGAVLGTVEFAAGCAGVTLDGFQTGSVTIAPDAQTGARAENITLRNIDGEFFDIFYANHITVSGGDWGPSHHSSRIAVYNPWDKQVPTDILVENAHFHDITMQDGEHTEGILVYAGNGIQIRGCTFNRIQGTGDLGLFFLHMDEYNPPVANILVENCTGSPEPHVADNDAYFNVQYDRLVPGLVFGAGNVWPRDVISFDYVPPKGITKMSPPANWPRSATPPTVPVRLVSETATTITLGWDPIPGAAGFRFTSEKGRISHTWDGSRTTVKFAKGSSWYRVESLSATVVGEYRP